MALHAWKETRQGAPTPNPSLSGRHHWAVILVASLCLFGQNQWLMSRSCPSTLFTKSELRSDQMKRRTHLFYLFILKCNWTLKRKWWNQITESLSFAQWQTKFCRQWVCDNLYWRLFRPEQGITVLHSMRGVCWGGLREWNRDGSELLRNLGFRLLIHTRIREPWLWPSFFSFPERLAASPSPSSCNGLIYMSHNSYKRLR